MCRARAHAGLSDGWVQDSRQVLNVKVKDCMEGSSDVGLGVQEVSEGKEVRDVFLPSVRMNIMCVCNASKCFYLFL